MDFGKLTAPFPPASISWRVGATTKDKAKGMALAYIDARDVLQRLDEVCGPAGWQNRYSHAEGKTICEIGIRCGEEWIWKADGAGDTDHEAEKGALSDAFKRAAVRWGIGRYLYDVASPWVEIEQRGNSYTIKEAEFAKLRGQLNRAAPGQQAPAAPEPAPSAGVDETDQRIANSLRKSIAGTKTPDALEKVLADADAIRSYESLPVVLKKAVNKAVEDHRDLLANLVQAG